MGRASNRCFARLECLPGSMDRPRSVAWRSRTAGAVDGADYGGSRSWKGEKERSLNAFNFELKEETCNSPQTVIYRSLRVLSTLRRRFRRVVPLHLDFHLLAVQLKLFVELLDERQVVGGQATELLYEALRCLRRFGGRRFLVIVLLHGLAAGHVQTRAREYLWRNGWKLWEVE